MKLIFPWNTRSTKIETRSKLGVVGIWAALLSILVGTAVLAQQQSLPLLGGTSRRQERTLFQQYGAALGGTLRRVGGPGAAFFEFAPTSGAGMTAACACTAPTGAKGEALTFTRASSATCLKTVGVAPQTTIANGDLVTCTTDQARVMPGTDGTTINGLLVEGASTNGLLHSSEFENVAWSVANAIIAAPIITANQAIAPDGTLTADRVQVSAAGSTNSAFSEVFQLATLSTSNNTCSMFVRGNGTTGTMSMRCTNGTNAFCVGCPYTSGAWASCSVTGTYPASASTGVAFGSFSTTTYACPGSDGNALDVFVWGAQAEIGSYASSYIATTNAAVTRATEVADLPVAWAAGSSGFSMASTANVGTITIGSTILATFVDNSPSGTAGLSANYIFPFPTTLSVMAIDATGSANPSLFSSTIPVSAGASSRFATYHTGSTLSVCVNGVCAPGLASVWNGVAAQRIRIGRVVVSNDSSMPNGVIKQVCLDQSPSRCR